MSVGISVRMAILMGLHNEETYLSSDPNPDVIAKAESARRTLVWACFFISSIVIAEVLAPVANGTLSGCFIVSPLYLGNCRILQLNSPLDHDNLYSGPKSPVSLAASDINALLPGSEGEFANGREPTSRAALQDASTPRATENLASVVGSGQSLFASLIQIRHYWGVIFRKVMSSRRDTDPWDPHSDFAETAGKLKGWEHGLPDEYTWNPSLTREYRNVGQEIVSLRLPSMAYQWCLTYRRHTWS